MAETINATRADGVVVQPEDLMSVRSRISWGAIVAGSALAIALYFLLTLLGAAIGLSIGDRVDANNLSIGAAIYAILITAVCLFVGGYTASQLTAGENRTEAAIYGLLVWAVVFALLLSLMATGVRAGFTAMVGVSTAGNNVNQGDFEAAARRAGYSQAQIESFKQNVQNAPAEARQAAQNPENEAAATRVAWYAFLGTLVSMLAGVAGGYVGSGPRMRLFAPLSVHSVTARREIIVPN